MLIVALVRHPAKRGAVPVSPQRLAAAANNAVDLAFGGGPTEPVATRPIWMQRVSGTYNFFCFHDGRDYDTQFEVFD